MREGFRFADGGGDEPCGCAGGSVYYFYHPVRSVSDTPDAFLR